MGSPSDNGMNPPLEPKIIRLPRNGPKPGQSTEAWLFGKHKHEQRLLEQERWKAAKAGKRKGG